MEHTHAHLVANSSQSWSPGSACGLGFVPVVYYSLLLCLGLPGEGRGGEGGAEREIEILRFLGCGEGQSLSFCSQNSINHPHSLCFYFSLFLSTPTTLLSPQFKSCPLPNSKILSSFSQKLQCFWTALGPRFKNSPFLPSPPP